MKLNKMNTVKFNGTDIDRVKFNGSEMWNAWTYAQGAPPLTLSESIGKPLKRLYAEGADGGTGDLNEETGKYDVPITVRGKNLISTGSGINMTIHGVTIKRNDDGSLTFNGATTTSGWDEINLCQIYGRLNRKKRYTFSAKGAVVTQLQYEVQLRKNGACVENVCTQTIPTFNFSTYTKEFDEAVAKLLILSGATFNNLTVYPQLEEGGAATPYEPYRAKTDLTVSLDAPLHSGEGAYINAEIPTVKGTTIIEVNTSVPPAALKTYYRKGR